VKSLRVRAKAMAVFKPRSKPHSGMLLHFENDSVLTGSVAAAQAAADLAAAAQARPPSGPVLEWPRKESASALGGYPPAPRPASASRQSRLPLPEVPPQSRLSMAGPERSSLGMPTGSRVSVSITELGKVLDVLVENEGVSKSQVFACLRAKPRAPLVDRSFDRSFNNDVTRSRPSSALEKLERYQFNTRPTSAAAVKRQNSVPSLCNQADSAQDLARGAAQRSLSQGRGPAQPKLRRENSVPTPSLLNFSRPFTGMRSTCCW